MPRTPNDTPRLLLFNKPYGVLSQFRDEAGHPGLSAFGLPAGFYAAGRLDRDSEGLLLLTNHGPLQARISEPRYKLPKTYWVQVEGEIGTEALAALRAGPTLRDGPSRPSSVQLLREPALPARDPPIRQRRNIPTCWLQIVLNEGRNRQVRRTTAAVGHPTLRLFRQAVGPLEVGNLPPGQWRECPAASIAGLWGDSAGGQRPRGKAPRR